MIFVPWDISSLFIANCEAKSLSSTSHRSWETSLVWVGACPCPGEVTFQSIPDFTLHSSLYKVHIPGSQLGLRFCKTWQNARLFQQVFFYIVDHIQHGVVLNVCTFPWIGPFLLDLFLLDQSGPVQRVESKLFFSLRGRILRPRWGSPKVPAWRSHDQYLGKTLNRQKKSLIPLRRVPTDPSTTMFFILALLDLSTWWGWGCWW